MTERPRRGKGGRNPVRRTVLTVLVLLAVLLGIGGLREMCGGAPGGSVTVTVPEGASAADVAALLREEGLIRRRPLFRLYSRLRGADGDYQYGTFRLRKGSGYARLIRALTEPVAFRETVTVTFPEGFNAFQMAEVCESAGLCDGKAFLEAASSPDYPFDFLRDVSADPRKLVLLEGFLFPDTYSFFADAEPEEIITALLRNFEEKILTEENRRAIAGSPLSLEEVIVLSSIIQKESASVEEMGNVSSVFVNRMRNRGEYPRLQSDTTNNFIWDYVEPYYGGDPPREVIDAYDTYGRDGLPVGAIANPGTDAVRAALHPADTPYRFFVCDVERHHYYGTTHEEHLRNIEKAKAVNRAHGIDGIVTR